MKGGKREGAGRPKAAPTIPIRVRLTPDQHAAYERLGAEHWLKRILSEQHGKNKHGTDPAWRRTVVEARDK